MPTIHLTTFIAAPVERVFDLSRSLELHRASMNRYQEKTINGVVSGLMKPGDTVTWQARHLRRERILKVNMTAMKAPESFTDEQLEGVFTYMKHEHFFKPTDNGTLMIDLFHYDVPYGLFGKWFNALYLKKYLARLLNERNAFIKETAETNRWKQYLQA